MIPNDGVRWEIKKKRPNKFTRLSQNMWLNETYGKDYKTFKDQYGRNHYSYICYRCKRECKKRYFERETKWFDLCPRCVYVCGLSKGSNT